MKIFITLFFVAASAAIFAQSKKDIKDAGVISRTETTVKSEKGSSVSFVESVEKYDDNGNKTEVIEYKSNGDILAYTQYSYNEKGRLIKEVRLNPVNKQPKTTIEFQYSDDGKLQKEIHYDSRNQLKKTSEFKYDGNLKISKTTTNASGKIVETKTYSYVKK